MKEEEFSALCEIAEIVNGLKLSDLAELDEADFEEHPLIEIGAIVAEAFGGKFIPGELDDGVRFIEDGAAPTPEPDFIEA
jgi:hypothetical protein